MDKSTLIFEARKRKGLLQTELAIECGVTRGSINRYEHGRDPKGNTLTKICKVLGITKEEMAAAIKAEQKKKGLDLGEKKAMEFLKNYEED